MTAAEPPTAMATIYSEHVSELVDGNKNVVVSRIPDRAAILGSIKEFLSTGR